MSGFSIERVARSAVPGCRIAEDDYAVLQRMASGHQPLSERYRDLLGTKLRGCIVYPSGGLPLNVQLNTCFTYAIDGNQKDATILVRYPPSDLPPFALSLYTMRGLALLGLAEGETLAMTVAGGASEDLELVRVLRQPAR